MIKNSKGTLARLLGKENIEIREGNYSTAAFDTKNRILMLPKWDLENEGLLDMLLGHEISHALYTEHSALEQFTLDHPGKFDIFNCIEDIRIERKIQDRYPGLIRQFRTGRQYLLDQDILQIAGKDINSFRFIDRLNIKAKLGEFLDVQLTDQEQDLYQRCLKAETMAEVLALTEEAIQMVREEQQQNPDPGPEPETSPQESPGGDDEGPEDNESQTQESGEDDGTEAESSADESSADESSADESSADESGDPTPTEEQTQSPSDGAGDTPVEAPQDVDYSSETQDNLDKFLKDSVNKSESNPMYPQSDEKLLEHIITYDKLRTMRYNSYKRTDPEKHSRFEHFRKKQENRVNYMVNEFQRKKAAYQYSRSTEARTGQLNMNKLHQYKVDDNIFRSLTRLADSKDHGMIMFIDYSASMQGYLESVIEQTLVLCMFCKKVGIPFQVFSFTSRGSDTFCGENDTIPMNGVHIVELVSSWMNKSTYTEAIELLHERIYTNGLSEPESLGGTPLDQTIIAAAPIIEEFNRKNRVQKTNVVFLTDGESQSIIGGNQKESIRWRGMDVEYKWHQGTARLLAALKKITGCTLIGYRLCRRISTIAHRMGIPYVCEREFKNREREFKKNKYVAFSNTFGCDILFAIKQDSLDLDDDTNTLGDKVFDINDAAGMRELQKQFKNNGKNNKESRIFLNKFTDVIC